MLMIFYQHYLRELQDSSENTTTEGVDENLASIVNNVWSKPISGDRIKGILAKYKQPENCKNLFVKKCNTEIWSEQLSVKQRTKDLQQQKIQLNLVKGGCAITRSMARNIIDIKKNKELSTHEIKNRLNTMLVACTDTMTIMGTAYMQIDHTRRFTMVVIALGRKSHGPTIKTFLQNCIVQCR